MILKQRIGFILGIGLFCLCVFWTPTGNISPLAMKAAGVSLLMAVFWFTEAISTFTTAFIPVALFLLLGVLDAKQIAASYGHHIVILIIGVFLLLKQ